jgi:acetyl esterase/lipase
VALRRSYGNDPSQFGELWLPDGEGPHPVAVVLHGGFWRHRYDLRLMEALCADLAGHGRAAWNVEYRRLGGGGGWPATLDDVAAAIDRLADLDARLDLRRVATVGHSAGGHLALWAATRERPGVPVTAAVGQAAVTDLAHAARLALSGGVVAELLGGPPEAVPERYAAASPIERLPAGVPVLLVHGARDDTVPVSLSRDYLRAAVAAGGACDLVVGERDGHFEHLDPASAAWGTVIRWLCDR